MLKLAAYWYFCVSVIEERSDCRQAAGPGVWFIEPGIQLSILTSFSTVDVLLP